MADAPSPRQRVALHHIAEHHGSFGYAITVRQLCEAMGIRSTNGAADHLRRLRKKGLIEGTGRALTITTEGQKHLRARAA